MDQELTFQSITEGKKIPVLGITVEDKSAKGIFIPSAILLFNSDTVNVVSCSDTGVFVLFAGSYTVSTNKRYRDYIKEQKTTREIVFQSRNAAAQFVLGEQGRTDSWKEIN